MSVFGNYDYAIILKEYGNPYILIYSSLFLLSNIITLIMGYKLKISSIVKYSIFFIILNLYIRYFEYFYFRMNTWIFFIILGSSTIIIGIIIERIIKYR